MINKIIRSLILLSINLYFALVSFKILIRGLEIKNLNYITKGGIYTILAVLAIYLTKNMIFEFFSERNKKIKDDNVAKA